MTLDDILTPNDSRLLKRTIQRFIEYYRFSNRHEIAKRSDINHDVKFYLDDMRLDGSYCLKTLSVINSGDCGVAALAIGEVMRVRGNMDMFYFDNGKHATMVWCLPDDGSGLGYCYVDTLVPNGVYSESGVFGHNSKTKGNLYTAEQHAAAWLPDDHLGKEIIEQFVRFYDPDYRYPYAISDRESEVYS